MNTIYKLIKKNANLIIHIICTLFLCVFFALFLERYSEYVLFTNLILCLLMIYCFYRMIFKKNYADSFLKIICILMMIVASNHLYSYTVLVEKIPWLSDKDSNGGLILMTIVFLVVMLIFKLLTYIDIPKKRVENRVVYGDEKGDKHLSTDEKGIAKQLRERKSSSPELEGVSIKREKKVVTELFSFFQFLCVFIGLCILIVGCVK